MTKETSEHQTSDFLLVFPGQFSLYINWLRISPRELEVEHCSIMTIKKNRSTVGHMVFTIELHDAIYLLGTPAHQVRTQ